MSVYFTEHSGLPIRLIYICHYCCYALMRFFPDHALTAGRTLSRPHSLTPSTGLRFKVTFSGETYLTPSLGLAPLIFFGKAGIRVM